MLAKGERAYSLVDERQTGKRRLRQGEKLNFRCRKPRETRPLYVEAEPLQISCSAGHQMLAWRLRSTLKNSRHGRRKRIIWPLLEAAWH
ncbi:hypothetical protein TNCV_3594391 [Trichonephila clavipes]|nr:hypothetical protein TNCV_3594391 [Trichonephila clavipes]